MRQSVLIDRDFPKVSGHRVTACPDLRRCIVNFDGLMENSNERQPLPVKENCANCAHAKGGYSYGITCRLTYHIQFLEYRCPSWAQQQSEKR